MPTIESYIEYLKTYPKDTAIACHLWQEDDVLGVAKQEGKTLSRKQVQDILETVHNKVDCEYGITWETIRYHVQEAEDLTVHWEFCPHCEEEVKFPMPENPKPYLPGDGLIARCPKCGKLITLCLLCKNYTHCDKCELLDKLDPEL